MSKKFLLFLAFAFITLNIGLGSWGLTESSEARYAEIPREMLANNDFINPTLLGIYHYHKPPLTYWITAVGYKIFGTNEFGARFFLQIAIVLQLLLVYKLAQLLYSNKTISFLSALVYFSFPLVLISSRNLTTDAYLTTFILAAIYFWLARFKREHGVWALYAFYLCLGLTILTKGPVALLFVLTFIIAYSVTLHQKMKTSIHGIFGLILFFGVSLSWFLILLNDNPSLLNYFLGRQLEDRIISNSFDRGKPFYYFILLLPALLFPWVILPFSVTREKWRNLFKIKDETTVLAVSSVILILIFSLFKTKLILYILPIFWMIALLIAKKLTIAKPAILKTLNATYAIFCVLIVLAILLFYFSDILKVNISIDLVVCAILSIAVWLVFYFKVKKNNPLNNGLLAAGFSAVLLLLGMFFMKDNNGEINSIRDVSKFVETVNPSSEKNVLVYNYLLNSAPFYLDGNIVTINAGHNTTQRDTQFQQDVNWKKNLINFNDNSQIPYLRSLVSQTDSFLLFRKKDGNNEKLQILLSNFSKRKEFKKWVVCYN